MKNKEDMALKCALVGGVLGLLLGLVAALASWKENGGGVGAFTVVDALTQIVLWCFICALFGGVVVYASLWVAERKLGLGPDDEQGPGRILQKTSFLRGLLAETNKSYLDIGGRVALAEKYLAAAEKEFAEGAFAPFWDEIERAANQLAAYKNEVEHLQRSVSVYNIEAEELAQLGGESMMPLALPLGQLPDARPSAARFVSIVRKAQTNFEFAMIFEQRKTNQLLHTGFGTLGSAIHSLGESINASLDKLSKSLDTNTDRLITVQAPLRHLLAKIATKDQNADPAEPLPRYDPKQG